MKHTSRTALFALAVLAACSDNAVAPRGPAIQAPSADRKGWKGALTSNMVQFRITIDPKEASSFQLGSGNWVTIPAHSVCDLTKSGYGPDSWDKPCQPADAPITVEVTAWADASGHPQVDFSPDLRFVPTLDPESFAYIEFRDPVAAGNPAFNILYCRPKNPNAKPGCTNESLTDPSLVTVRDAAKGRLARRIKHFSGYNVAAGDMSDPTLSMNLVTWDDGDGSVARVGQSKASGFMLASGRQ
jgi:hypothetical protein